MHFVDKMGEIQPEEPIISRAPMNLPEPTPAMIAFFELRTHAHIERVHQCLSLLAEDWPHPEALLERGRTHDASKFGPEERIPYIWLTEYHRCRRKGQPFSYPDGVEAQVRVAIAHHLGCNSHHPEFYPNVNDMPEIDLLEMICDWTAMAQEFHPEEGSARRWADKKIGTSLHFGPDQHRFILNMIAVLDTQIARHQQAGGGLGQD